MSNTPSKLAIILQSRKELREETQQGIQTSLAEQNQARKETLEGIIHFLEESKADPEYGDLIDITIAEDFSKIQVTPTNAAYEKMRENEYPEAEPITITQAEIGVLEIRQGLEVLPTEDREDALEVVEQKVANLVEMILDLG
jgi:hypothetical protein